MHKPKHVEELDWKGTKYRTEFYDIHSFENLENVTQVQAVPFTENGEIVLLEHVDGYFSLPGGHIEKGENIEKALKRELEEEVSVKTKNFGPIGYIKNLKLDDPNFVEHQPRFWATVSLSEETSDPDGKVVGRVLVSEDEAVEKLNWGERGRLFIELAKKHLRP